MDESAQVRRRCFAQLSGSRRSSAHDHHHRRPAVQSPARADDLARRLAADIDEQVVIRGIAVIVGALFIGQIITFAVGSSLIDSYLSGDSAKPTLVTGVLLEMCSAVAIVVIGL